MPGRPPRVAVLSSQQLIGMGLIAMLNKFPGRFELVEPHQADVILYDVFGIHQCDGEDLTRILHRTCAVVIAVSRDLRPDLRARALSAGAHGWISMSATPAELIQAVEAAADRREIPDPGDRLGQEVGLTVREVEVVALITQGMSNQEIAERLYLSVNSVKTYVRTAYAKIGVTSRAQAVAWALQHGFAPPDHEAGLNRRGLGRTIER